MKFTIHIRVLVYLILTYTAIYVFVGIQQSNFYRRISSARAQTASVDRKDVQVGILYNTSEDSSSFLNGVDLALQEINNRTNAINGKGLLFMLPDGKSAVTRKIRPIYLPIRTSKDLTIVSPLESSLKWKKNLVAIVSNLSTTMTLRTRVIPEYYGIAVLAVRPTLPSLTQEDFKYFVRTVPNFHYLAEYFMDRLPALISKKSGKRIKRIGIFFATSSPEGYLDELIAAREVVNVRVKLVNGLQAAFDVGVLNDSNDIEELKSSKYLQTAIEVDSSLVERFIEDNLTEADLKKPITLKEIVERFGSMDTETELVFTKPFIPNQKDYRPLIVSAEGTNPDLIVMASGIPDALGLIRQIREMGIDKPVMVTRINEYEQLLDIPTDRLTNVYGAAMYDPNSNNQRFLSFKERYGRFCQARNKPVRSPNFQSVQGYEAVYLIADVIEKSHSAIPMNIINTLKYSTTPIQGQIFDSYSFSVEGDILNRKLYPLFIDRGVISTIKED